MTTADIASVWPRAEEFGFANEEAAFALQYGHGVGLAIWEKPIFSRLCRSTIQSHSRKAWRSRWRPTGLRRTAGRRLASRKGLVVTADGCEVITKFPAEELLVAGKRYWTASGYLNTLRESQSHLNTPSGPEVPTP